MKTWPRCVPEARSSTSNLRNSRSPTPLGSEVSSRFRLCRVLVLGIIVNVVLADTFSLVGGRRCRVPQVHVTARKQARKVTVGNRVERGMQVVDEVLQIGILQIATVPAWFGRIQFMDPIPQRGLGLRGAGSQ